MANKTGIVLQGGGANGRYSLEILAGLEEAGLKYDALYGVSVGAIAAMLASKMSARDACGLWDEHINGLFDIFSPLQFSDADGIVNMAPVRKLLEATVAMPDKRPYMVGCCDWDTGRNWDIQCKDNPKALDAVIGSSSVPILVDPQPNTGFISDPLVTEVCDGGQTQNTPLKPALNDGCDRLFVIMTMPALPQMGVYVRPSLEDRLTWPALALMGRALRSLNMLIHAAMLDDIDALNYVKGVESHVITPTFDMGEGLDFGPANRAVIVAEARANLAVFLKEAKL